MSKIYNQFKRTWNDGKSGFGRESYLDAVAAGYTPQQIAAGLYGKRVGKRAQDMIEAAQPAYGAGESAASTLYQDQIQDLSSRIEDYDDKISDYEDRIGDFNTRISAYTTQVNDLTGKYNDALKTADEYAKARDQFESQFKQASADYEAARQEADRYREEAVGQQLRAVRSGSTAGGANQSQSLAGGLASGRTGYSSGSDDGIGKLAEMMRAQGGLTDSVLSREGPVVQQISSTGGSGQSTSGAKNTSAGTGSYYLSRFGA